MVGKRSRKQLCSLTRQPERGGLFFFFFFFSVAPGAGRHPALALPAHGPSPSACHESDLVRLDGSLMWTNCH